MKTSTQNAENDKHDTSTERATRPEDLARLFVERGLAGDAEGLAELYEPDAVLGYPSGQSTVGREAIRAVFEKMLSHRPPFRLEEALPTLRWGDLALTGTLSADNVGVRAQIARRQPDGTWLRIIDRPEVPALNEPSAPEC